MEFLDHWLAHTDAQLSHLPKVTLSFAQSLDGSISRNKGKPFALSSPESLKLTHRLRAANDAILIGIETVLADDPQLNVRLADGKDPQVVVLDSHLRTPISFKLMQKQNKPWIFCTNSADQHAQSVLERNGARVFRDTEREETGINIKKMLLELKKRGIGSVLIEGGGEVIQRFVGERHVDRAMITIAPVFVDGYRPFASIDLFMGRLKNVEFRKAGADIMVFGLTRRQV